MNGTYNPSPLPPFDRGTPQRAMEEEEEEGGRVPRGFSHTIPAPNSSSRRVRVLQIELLIARVYLHHRFHHRYYYVAIRLEQAYSAAYAYEVKRQYAYGVRTTRTRLMWRMGLKLRTCRSFGGVLGYLKRWEISKKAVGTARDGWLLRLGERFG